jgi:tetratricopeptide (TPR) repeat protein
MEITVLKPDRKKLEAKLTETKRRLEKHPYAWFRLEQAGRILRALGDPQASEFLRQAIANYKFVPLRSGQDRPGDFMRVGNLHRLLGDQDGATRHFERARQRYAEDISEKMQRSEYADPSLEIEHMIQPSFLVGRDQEVAELIERLRLYYRGTDLAAFRIARLAAARQARDADLAAEAVNQFARSIQRTRANIWDTGGVLPWDWYEIATQVWQDLADRESGPQGVLSGSTLADDVGQ